MSIKPQDRNRAVTPRYTLAVYSDDNNLAYAEEARKLNRAQLLGRLKWLPAHDLAWLADVMWNLAPRQFIELDLPYGLRVQVTAITPLSLFPLPDPED